MIRLEYLTYFLWVVLIITLLGVAKLSVPVYLFVVYIVLMIQLIHGLVAREEEKDK